MTPPDLQLPDDVDTLKVMVLAMAEKAARTDALESEVSDLKVRNADADERIERLTQILKAFDRARVGRRSEKLGSPGIDDEQQVFAFEEIETGIAAIRAKVNKGASIAVIVDQFLGCVRCLFIMMSWLASIERCDRKMAAARLILPGRVLSQYLCRCGWRLDERVLRS